ncbi:MAG: asparagine--tRNA ligase [Nanoarchaeota archaeon]|nr:asparagine--tRNA ligase [Nanoarchaeota archaeon]
MIYKNIEYCFNKGESKDVNVRGWVHRLRKQKDNIFLTLRDSTGIIQCILPFTEEYNKVTIESSVEISGNLIKDERSPSGYEIHANNMNIVGLAENYPIRKDFSVAYLNTVRHLWNRSRKMQSIMKVKSEAMSAAGEWFKENNWYQTTPPIINNSACEGGSTLFELDFFGNKAYLSQSAQLYLETLIFSLEKVWSSTTSFRAEKSKTPRHLAEYTHLEGEQAWANFEDILKVEEELLTHIVQRVVQNNHKDLEFLKQDVGYLSRIKTPFDRITYEEAISFLNKKGFDMKFGDDFGTEEERQLTSNLDNPLFLISAPVEAKPFYTKINPDDERMVLSADILAPRGFGEISTGGQREDDIESLTRRIKKEGLNPKEYDWYMDLRKYGSVPHSGFGFGLERIVRWICNLDHIRDTTPNPRSVSKSYP